MPEHHHHPEWATDPLLREYHEKEWGKPIHDERGIFERLSLGVFQTGLSWATILHKRAAFEEVFAHFEPDQVAKISDKDLEGIQSDPRIIRNPRKIRAIVTNAQATVALRAEGGLPKLVWSFRPSSREEETSKSIALSGVLKKKGFVFVGPTTMLAFMRAIGIVKLSHEE